MGGRFRNNPIPSASALFGYSYTGFLSLQQAIDKYIIDAAAANNGGLLATELQASVSLMPTRAFRSDNFFEAIGGVLGLFFMLAFIYPVSRLIRALVVEKELKLKEGMRMMGLRRSVLDITWLLTFALQMLLTTGIITFATSSSVFEYSSASLVFVWLFSFAMACGAQCFFISVFFSRSKTAAGLGSMIFFVSYFPYYGVQDNSAPRAAKLAACVFAPSCMGVAGNVIAAAETDLAGVQWATLGKMTAVNVSFLDALFMLWVDFAGYFFLYWCVRMPPSSCQDCRMVFSAG